MTALTLGYYTYKKKFNSYFKSLNLKNKTTL